jgi:hypothetical protein
MMALHSVAATAEALRNHSYFHRIATTIIGINFKRDCFGRAFEDGFHLNTN